MGANVPLILKIALQKLYFCHILKTKFYFKITSFPVFCPENFIFFIIKLSWEYYELVLAFKSRAPTLFLFFNPKTFYRIWKHRPIVIGPLTLTLDRFKVFIRVNISEFSLSYVIKTAYLQTGLVISIRKFYKKGFMSLDFRGALFQEF